MRFFGRKHRRHPVAMLHPVNVYDYNHPPVNVVGMAPWVWDIMSQRWIQSLYLMTAAPVAVPMVQAPPPASGVGDIF